MIRCNGRRTRFNLLNFIALFVVAPLVDIGWAFTADVDIECALQTLRATQQNVIRSEIYLNVRTEGCVHLTIIALFSKQIQ